MTGASAIRASMSPASRLEQLLDKDFLSHVIARATQAMNWPRQAGFACITRVHPRSGGGFVAEADLRTPQADRSCFFIEVPRENLEAHAARTLHRFEKQARRLDLRGPDAAPFFIDTDLGICVRPRGKDELIDGLAAIAREDVKRPELLAGAENPDLLAHRLNRRAVLRYRRPSGSAMIVKLYKKGSDKPFDAIRTTALLEKTAFNESSPVRTPQTLAHLESWNGYAMAESTGVPLSHLTGQSRVQGMRLAGIAMGRLHRLPLRLQKNHAITDEITLLRDWARFVEPFLPVGSGIGSKALNAVESAFRDIGDGPASLIHRDFHDGQILCDGNRATLIDFDTACNGDPAQDIGNFLAHLDFAELLGTATEPDGLEAFLDGYRDAFQVPDVARIDAHRRATHLRLACIHTFAPEHADACKQLVAKALGA